MKIKVLGPGCVKCRGMEHRVRKVVAELNLSADVGKVEELQEIMNYGVMQTPALVIDEKVIIAGKLPTYKELKKLIANQN